LLLTLHFHFVILESTIIAAHGRNSSNLKDLAFQIADGMAENFVRFTFEFRSGLPVNFWSAEKFDVQPVRFRVSSCILGDECDSGAGLFAALRLIVKQAARGN